MRGPPFTPRNIPGTHFCYKLSRPKGLVRLEGLGQLKKIHLIGIRSRDLPACSIVPQPTTLPRAPTGTPWGTKTPCQWYRRYLGYFQHFHLNIYL
jgi:hypothetical protein